MDGLNRMRLHEETIENGQRVVLRRRLAVLVLLCLCARNAPADITHPDDVTGSYNTFNVFVTKVHSILDLVLASDVGHFADTLFLFFGILLAIGLIIRFMNKGLDLVEAFEALLFVAFVRVMMVLYGPITTDLWQWADAFGGGIQQAALGTSDLFFVPAFIKNTLDHIGMADVTIWDGINLILGVSLLQGICNLLSVLCYFAAAWGVWGYAIAKLVGWMFIPLLLFKRTAFLFDGWLRFFIGFLMYTVIARVNLSLSAVLISLFFDLPTDTYVAPTTYYTFPVHQMSDYLGLCALLIISICALISTGKFASTIAGGVGGMSEGIRGAIVATRMAFL